MRILLIDNYDSFTYNLAHLLAAVTGELPLVLTNDDPTFHDLDLRAFDAAVISPGPGRPERPADFGHSAALLRSELPVLGVCLGHQGIVHHCGGRVTHAPEPIHGRLSPVHHDGQGLLEGIPSPFEVVRYHSLIAEDLPPSLIRSAWTADGLLMGVRHRERPLWGVQFHPESICTEHGEALMANFCRMAATPRRSRTPPVSATPSVSTTPAMSEAVSSPETLQVFRRSLGVRVDPERVFLRLFAESADSFWLDGATDATRPGRSWMGDASGPRAEVLRYDVNTRSERLFDTLNRTLAERRIEAPVDSTSSDSGFNLGYVGYLGYELKADCDVPAPHTADTPDAALIFADRAVAFDADGAVSLMALGASADEVAPWLDEAAALLTALSQEAPTTRSSASRPSSREPPARYAHDDSAYLDNITACLQAIRDGESYELCLTTAGEVSTSTPALTTYLALRRGNPAPYAAFLRFGDLAIVSSSPERFLTINSAGVAESKPIKGTCARSADEREDWWLAESLRTSEKERAENLMIVDLVRNDLGRVCVPGSVHVPALFAIESYATVHQLVSTVRGQLRSDASTVDCVRACFPAGSMTGAPKRRTMGILDGLEGRARGVYSGALGYLSLDGAADLSVVIRTLVVSDGTARFGVGGAIVALSDPDAEVAEIHLKAKALLRALGAS